MKDCQVCLTTDHAADVPTCPFCGEASWIEAAPKAVESERDTTAADVSAARKGKR